MFNLNPQLPNNSKFQKIFQIWKWNFWNILKYLNLIGSLSMFKVDSIYQSPQFLSTRSLRFWTRTRLYSGPSPPPVLRFRCCIYTSQVRPRNLSILSKFIRNTNNHPSTPRCKIGSAVWFDRKPRFFRQFPRRPWHPRSKTSAFFSVSAIFSPTSRAVLFCLDFRFSEPNLPFFTSNWIQISSYTIW